MVSVSVHHWFTVGLVTHGFCFCTPLVYSRLGYNLVSVSIHHWFTVGLVTTWFLFLHHWFTVGLVTTWFLFLYTIHHWFATGLVTMWFLGYNYSGFCFYNTPLVCGFNRLGYNVVSISIHH